MSNEGLLLELKDHLTAKLGGIVDRVILFGSRVDNTAREYSDYDILIILNIDYDWRMENDILAVCNDINLKYDIVMDVKIISPSEMRGMRGIQPFIQDAISNGLSL